LFVILQLNPPLPVETPHGEGMAIVLIDYGLNWNTCFLVCLKRNRELKHYNSGQLKLAKNYTFEFAGG
jgi:hypothetical protein